MSSQKSERPTSVAQYCDRHKGAGQVIHETELVTANLPQVHLIAKQVRRRFPEAGIDDLVGDGLLGLVKAIRNFDHSRGVRLKTYAAHRIRGQMLDGLRNMRIINRNHIGMSKGSGPSSEHEPTAAVRSRLVFPGPQVLSDLLERSADRAETLEDPGLVYERQRATKMLTGAISRLHSVKRDVILMRYERGLTWKEIADCLNLPPWKPCDLHRVALMELRRAVKDRDLFGLRGAPRSVRKVRRGAPGPDSNARH
jgi:RNA polymerase sigma factor for flagellar operon FliA